jgi:hypothetical protein
MTRGAAAAVARLLGVLGLLAPVAAGCGDNLTDPPALEPADTLVIVAHTDDDVLFVQPELHTALASGTLTTVYVSTGDQVKGGARAAHTLMAARMGYSSVTGSFDWNCGYISLAGSPAYHCRLRDWPVSIIALDTADGGVYGDLRRSPLHMVEGLVPDIPILGRIEGHATVASIVASLSAIIDATRPTEIHALDLAATHGHDHSGHMLSSAFTLWAAAMSRYAGPMRWHRGYNTWDGDHPELSLPVTLSDADFAAVRPMVGAFEACYGRCGAPCGRSCQTFNPDHDGYLQRQYSSTRQVADTRGRLALDSGTCLSVSSGGEVVLADCAAAADVHLDPGGHLAIGDACLTSGAGNDDPIALAPCQDAPAQYWALDSDGLIWNGRPPEPVACAPVVDVKVCHSETPCCMLFDHVRCLGPGATPGAALAAPVCGSMLQPHWQFVPLDGAAP